MKRSPILRKSELRSKSRKHKDPVTPELRAYILARDKGCVGALLEMPGPCYYTVLARLEIDHILNGGTGKRGPSIPLNLVTLCSAHHREKTDNARAWRPLLVEYAARMEQR